MESFAEPANGSPNFADYATEVRLFRFNQPYANHNGGDLHFGSDGYLYIASGDGGAGGDPHDFGQSISSLLGKILRIDVDATPPAGHGLCGIEPQAYAAAPGNPFLGGQVQGCDEIWHIGLRNPFRFSFDRSNGDVFIGDVGQGISRGDRLPRPRSLRRRELGLALLRGQQPAQHQRLRPDRQLSLPHPRLWPHRRPLLGNRRLPLSRQRLPEPGRDLPLRRLLHR